MRPVDIAPWAGGLWTAALWAGVIRERTRDAWSYSAWPLVAAMMSG